VFRKKNNRIKLFALAQIEFALAQIEFAPAQIEFALAQIEFAPSHHETVSLFEKQQRSS